MSASTPTASCGCAATAATPETNPPGQPALQYRVGTYASFLQRMLGQIASPSKLATAFEGPWAISALTTRSPDDPTIGLIDAWAVALDVLTFYQERIVNEGFLGTATEHRSILELARAIGYELNPGVAASTYLSFTIEDVLGAPSTSPLPTAPRTPSGPTQGASTYNAGIVTLAAGTQVLSVPPQGQVSRTFETIAEIDARASWNLILPRLTRSADFALCTDGAIYLLGLRAAFPSGAPTISLPVSSLYPLNPDTPPLAGGTVTAIASAQIFVAGANSGVAVGDLLLLCGVNAAGQILTQVWQVRNVVVDNVRNLTRFDFADTPPALTFAPATFAGVTVPSTPVALTGANVAQYILNATLEDSQLQALMSIGDWDPATLATMVNSTPPAATSSQGCFAFGATAKIFGHNAQLWTSLPAPGTLLRGDPFHQDWDAANDGEGPLIWTDSQGYFHRDASLYLEQSTPGILSNSWMLAAPASGAPLPLKVISAADASLADYGLSGKSTGLVVQTAARQWIRSPTTPAIGILWGILYLFAANSDGGVYQISGIAGNWESFQPLMSGSFTSPPVVVGGGTGNFDVFAIGDDGHLYHANGYGGFFPQTLDNLRPLPSATTLTGSPSVIVGAPNQFDVFATGTDGVLYHFWKENNVWNGPEPHKPPGKIVFGGAPAATGGGPSTTEVFSIGSDGLLYHTGWTLATGWWGPLLIATPPTIATPSPLVGSPAAGVNGLNPIDVFALGADGALYHAWFIGNVWHGMENLGGVNFVGSPSLIIGGPSNLEVFMIGLDGQLYHKYWVNGFWSGPYSLGGGNLVGSPCAVAPTHDSIEVVALGSDGNFYHFWYHGAWNGPEMIAAGYVPQLYTRKTKAYVRSNQFALADLPILDDVAAGSTTLMLNGFITGLTPGQAVAVSGLSADSNNLTVAEVVLLTDIQHIGGYTQLEFALPGLQYGYLRSSLTLNANTAEATDGASIAVPEVLGSGNASAINQTFKLSRSPVTYVPAANAAGAESTLQIQINDLNWNQAPSLYGLGPTDRVFVAWQNDDGSTTIGFGDGVSGGLLPTGQNNVTATYRVGLGTAGNLAAGSISVAQSRPPGLRAVSNPVPASGGADPETLDGARDNAPRSVLTIDRIVSLSDYEAFARAFAGIGKAQAVALLVGSSVLIQLTVAGVEGAAVLAASPLLVSLADAIEAARDPAAAVAVAGYQPILFNIVATVIIDAKTYVQSAVHAAVAAAVESYFAFDQRDLAQTVSAAEVIATMQGVQGVVAVKLEQLYRNDDPTGPSQNAPPVFLAARGAQVGGGGVAPAEMLLLNPVGFTLNDQVAI